MKIPLFDIDGTLLKGGGGNQAHRKGFDYAFEKIYGLSDASIDEIKTDGMIDKQIILEVVKRHQISEEDALAKIDTAIESVTQYFFDHQDQSICEPLPGVVSLLEELQQKNIPLGLLTGNIDKIAWKKLATADIDSFFSFGAFGNLAFKRVDLIEIARMRANEALKANYVVQDFVIIGDSTRDVQCAKDGGISVIAVATGGSTMEELQANSADLVLQDFADTTAVFNFLQE